MRTNYPNEEIKNDRRNVEANLINININHLVAKFKVFPHNYGNELQIAEKKHNYDEVFYYFFLNKFLNNGYAEEALKDVSNWSKMANLFTNPIPANPSNVRSNFELLRDINRSLRLDEPYKGYTIADIFGFLYYGRKSDENLAVIAMNL